MSITAPAVLRRELDELDLAVRGAPAGTPHADLIARARALGRDARTVGIAEIAGVAALREGELLLASGAPTAAIQALRSAVDVLAATGSTDMLTTAMARLSDALVADGAAPSDVVDVCARGIDLAERDRYKTSAPYLQAGYLTRTIALYANGVRAAASVGDARYLAWMELSKSRVLPGASAHPSASPAGPADPVPDVAELEQRLATLGHKIDQYRARGRDDTSLRQQRRLLFDQLVARQRKGASLPDVDLDRVTGALAADQRALSYYWLDDATLLIAIIGPDGAQAHTRTVSPDDRSVLTGLARELLGQRGERPEPDAAVIDHAVARLAPVLLPEPVADAVRGAARLLVSPHRALHAVPFAALPLDGRPLIRHVAIAMVPNLTCLQQPDPPPRAPQVLAVGATDYAVPGHEAIPLVDARGEVEDIAAAYADAGVPVETLLDEEVTGAALAGRCADAATAPTCLHLAVHGDSVESDTPLESWLLLPHARLDGIDLVHWRLPGATVVLSACCSGQRAVGTRRLHELPGDDLLGLQTALFAAGARQVLGALWPVASEVARSLTTAFHTNFLAGMPADVALQQAVVAFLDGGDLVFRLSAFWWAPLFLSCVGPPLGMASVRR